MNIWDIRIVEDRLQAEIERAGGLRSLAREWGMAPSHLSMVARGQRIPGDNLLRKLDLAKVTGYVIVTAWRPIEGGPDA